MPFDHALIADAVVETPRWYPLLWVALAVAIIGAAAWFLTSRRVSERSVQDMVHKLEEGGWAGRLRVAVRFVAFGFVIYVWLFSNTGFKGLSHEKAIEQAEISREIARGNGFSTKMIRPAALWLFEKNKGGFPVDQQPDVFHA